MYVSECSQHLVIRNMLGRILIRYVWVISKIFKTPECLRIESVLTINFQFYRLVRFLPPLNKLQYLKCSYISFEVDITH